MSIEAKELRMQQYVSDCMCLYKSTRASACKRVRKDLRKWCMTVVDPSESQVYLFSHQIKMGLKLPKAKSNRWTRDRWILNSTPYNDSCIPPVHPECNKCRLISWLSDTSTLINQLVAFFWTKQFKFSLALSNLGNESQKARISSESE